MDILITGAGGGIGYALVAALHHRYPDARIAASWYRSAPPVDTTSLGDAVTWYQCDCSKTDEVAQLAANFERLDWLVNCVGFLHGDSALPNAGEPSTAKFKGPEKTIAAFDSEFFLQNIKINTLPSLLLAQHFMPPLKNSKNGLFATVSAKVGSIEDNRLGGWYSYRSSKAALNMALKTLSIEWQHKCPGVCVAALHPGTTDTQLSKPFQANVPATSLFSPERTANYLVDVLAQLSPSDTGSFLAFDGQSLPW